MRTLCLQTPFEGSVFVAWVHLNGYSVFLLEHMLFYKLHFFFFKLQFSCVAAEQTYCRNLGLSPFTKSVSRVKAHELQFYKAPQLPNVCSDAEGLESLPEQCFPTGRWRAGKRQFFATLWPFYSDPLQHERLQLSSHVFLPDFLFTSSILFQRIR